MKQNQIISKAELARHIGVSRAYVTMLFNGKRSPTEEIVNKLHALGVTLNQQVTGSIPVRLTLDFWNSFLEFYRAQLYPSLTTLRIVLFPLFPCNSHGLGYINPNVHNISNCTYLRNLSQ
ncbi:helix-turn-helix domain-containing protein [Chloroflexota bacterium]